MIRQKLFRNRSFKLSVVLIAFGMILFLARFIDGAYETDGWVSPVHRLNLMKSFNVPVAEISGMTLSEDQSQVFFVGDHSAVVGIHKLNQGASVSLDEFSTVDLNHAIFERFPICASQQDGACHHIRKSLTSQWEAIQKEPGKQRLFLMNEQLASIYVFDIAEPTTSKLVKMINLVRFQESSASQEEKFSHQKRKNVDSDGNSLSEGFILLRQGHLLVLREKSRPQIIEFGISGEKPQGFEPAKRISGQETFSLRDDLFSEDYVPLHAWNLPKGLGNCDLSELQADPQGNLFLLSQTCRWVSRVKSLDVKSAEMIFEDQWKLPHNLKNAEAFVILKDGSFLVGEDKKSIHGQNVHHLSLPTSVAQK